MSSTTAVSSAATDNLKTPETARSIAIKNMIYNLKKAQAQYIHVKAKTIGTLPKWHKNAAGQNPAALMYFDEIIVK